jgi:hypothetical protein
MGSLEHMELFEELLRDEENNGTEEGSENGGRERG